MDAVLILRGQHQEKNIGRSPVDRAEIDPRGVAPENDSGFIEFFNPSVRNCYAITDTCTAEALPFLNNL